MNFEQLTNQLENLYDKAIEAGDYKHEGENYMVNCLYCWPDGRWEERCDNESGSSFGGMRGGTFSLSKEQKAAFDGCHKVIDFD